MVQPLGAQVSAAWPQPQPLPYPGQNWERQQPQPRECATVTSQPPASDTPAVRSARPPGTPPTEPPSRASQEPREADTRTPPPASRPAEPATRTAPARLCARRDPPHGPGQSRSLASVRPRARAAPPQTAPPAALSSAKPWQTAPTEPNPAHAPEPPAHTTAQARAANCEARRSDQKTGREGSMNPPISEHHMHWLNTRKYSVNHRQNAVTPEGRDPAFPIASA